MDFNWSKEQLDIAREIRSFATSALNEDLGERDQKGEYSYEMLELMKENGLMGIDFPEEYDGMEAGMIAQCVAVEEIAKADAATALSIRHYHVI